jgi:hypothetical protein
VRFCESPGTATGSDEIPALIRAWRLAEAGNATAMHRPSFKGRIVPAAEYLLGELATLCNAAVRRFCVQNLVKLGQDAAAKTQDGEQMSAFEVCEFLGDLCLHRLHNRKGLPFVAVRHTTASSWVPALVAIGNPGIHSSQIKASEDS